MIAFFRQIRKGLLASGATRKYLLYAIGEIALPRPFPRMTYETAMNRYGTDRPDLRFEMTFEDATDIFLNTHYSIFRQIIDKGGEITGMMCWCGSCR